MALRKKRAGQAKKRAGQKALLKKIVSTLFSPVNSDLILIGGATLLVRVRAPPETWTNRLRPHGQPEAVLVDHLFRHVINFSNDFSEFERRRNDGRLANLEFHFVGLRATFRKWDQTHKDHG
ncbi:MAG: hypothetical protein KGK16_16585 [Bradyrhizobium sp.]|nr:hypothetical protein [Bradyrhizobium sp.]